MSQSAFAVYNKRKTKSRKAKKSPQNVEEPTTPPPKVPAVHVPRKKAKTSRNNWRESIIPENGTSDSSQVESPERKIASKPSTTGCEGFEVTARIENFTSWLLAPITFDTFISDYWESNPLLIKRNNENYYKDLLSSEQLDEILRKNQLFHTRNVDVVKFENGKRNTFTCEGRANASELWDFYNNGCSIRILNPQTYSTKLQSLLAGLQEKFGCMVGANVYLTPPHSQGFAPHYDDIEAFVIQLEGRKHWKLYSPLDDKSELPRFSSSDFNADEIGEPIKELVLEAGDLLYFQRGIIHQGSTTDSHSLHVTISMYQKTTYLDLLEHIFKPALQKAAQDIEFRRGLPVNYLKHVGTACNNVKTPIKKKIVTRMDYLMNKLIQNYVSVDSAADEMGKRFMWDAIPPVPFKEEESCMSVKDGERLLNGTVVNAIEISVDVKIRLFRYYSLHIAEENNQLNVYYCTENARVYHGEEQQILYGDIKQIEAFRYLIQSYPRFVTIDSLPIEGVNIKCQFVSDLWEKNLIVTNKPFNRVL